LRTSAPERVHGANDATPQQCDAATLQRRNTAIRQRCNAATPQQRAQAAVRRGRRGHRQRAEDVVVDDRDQPGRRVRVRRLAGEHAYHGVLRGTHAGRARACSMDCTVARRRTETGTQGVLKGYPGSTQGVLEGHSMDCGRAGTDGEGRPEPDARGPQADRRAPAHTCARTGARLGSPPFFIVSTPPR
jgi:hypothetical protein